MDTPSKLFRSMATASTCVDHADALNAWPNCTVADCPNKACLHLHPSRCWPHTVGMPINWFEGLGLSEKQIEARVAEIEKDYLS